MPTDPSDLLQQVLTETARRTPSPTQDAPPSPAAPKTDHEPDPRALLLAGLSALEEKELQALVKALSSDDLLTIMSRAQPPLQKKVLEVVSEESAQWLGDNLKLMGEPTDAAFSHAAQSTLQTLESLAKSGALTWPPQAPDPQLRSRIEHLISLATQSDLQPLKDALATEEPLLALGVKRLLAGDEPRALARTLATERERLERLYAKRQAEIMQALLAGPQ